eukprot:PhM_4_TR17070/c0_g1_i1/m.87207/K09571/FKBP4_5; FK506-binding protein 4/5
MSVEYHFGEEVEVPNTDGKLHKTLLVAGTPNTTPKDGAKVSVHYVGTLASDGSKFDSSRDRDQLFEFDLGKGSVIKGWDVGVATMNKGEKCILRCHPDYAYGNRAMGGSIPANSTLVFEVELFDWTTMQDVSGRNDKSLLKDITAKGDGFRTPAYETKVVVDVKCRSGVDVDSPGAVEWEKSAWEIVIGECEEQLTPALQHLIETMHKGESCVGVSKKDQKTYDVTLHDMTVVEVWSTEESVEDKIKAAQTRREQGNAYFKAGKLVAAAQKYNRSLEFLDCAEGRMELDEEDGKKRKREVDITMRVPVLNNLSQVALMNNDLKDAIGHANKCLVIDANNAKALFRRGKANALLNEPEAAQSDFRAIVAMDASNEEAKRELAAVAAKVEEEKRRQKQRFGNMFERMAKMEEKEHA